MTLSQVKAEALAESVTVTWRDRKFTIRPVDEWMTRFIHFMDRDKMTLALEEALGSQQYAKFIDATPPPSLADTGALINTIASAFGLEIPES